MGVEKNYTFTNSINRICVLLQDRAREGNKNVQGCKYILNRFSEKKFTFGLFAIVINDIRAFYNHYFWSLTTNYCSQSHTKF